MSNLNDLFNHIYYTLIPKVTGTGDEKKCLLFLKSSTGKNVIMYEKTAWFLEPICKFKIKLAHFASNSKIMGGCKHFRAT